MDSEARASLQWCVQAGVTLSHDSDQTAKLRLLEKEDLGPTRKKKQFPVKDDEPTLMQKTKNKTKN